MKIGVIADTHIPRASKTVPREIFKWFEGAGLILHAGDVTEEAAIAQLETIAPVVAVHGNRDSEYLKEKLPDSRILELEGFRIGMLHGHGDKGTTLQRLPDFFKGETLDCIIFGHSHIPFNQKINHTLYFNPGSPTVKKRQKYPSVGILLLGQEIHADIVYLNQKQTQEDMESEDT